MPVGYEYSEKFNRWVRVQQDPKTPSCKFNIGVQCSPQDQHCETCGHNPEVAKARLQKLFPGYEPAK